MVILNSKQVMELLNIKSPTTLLKYEADGRIKYHQPVRKKYYYKHEVMEFFNS
ncbi:hypothetical protein [Yeosuana marina]|uniref:hypothetical protein n=1 Tax=Yeosuana marina TaxID=1565536 RepID=UPI0030C7E8A5